MKRAELAKWMRFRVSRECMLLQEGRLIQILARMQNGPLVMWDQERRCWGLFADRDYDLGEKVTEYGGEKSLDEVAGPYVAFFEKTGLYVDGYSGFLLGEERGRWVNEYDAARSFVNVELGRVIRTTRPVKRGEQFFGDYGGDYQRDYD